MRVIIVDHGNVWGKSGDDNHWWVATCSGCHTSVFHSTKKCPVCHEELEWDRDNLMENKGVQHGCK